MSKVMPSRKYTNSQIKAMSINYITPIKSYTFNNRTWWECLCSCGKVFTRTEKDLVRGIRLSIKQSCGCLRTWSQIRIGNENPAWKGFGSLNGHYIAQIKGKCKKNNREFSVDKEYLWKLFENQNGLCALSKLPINFSTITERRGGKEQTASLDRIDSSKGYIEGNVQWVHKDVQWMKQDYSQERYIEICKLVATNN